MKRIDIDLPGEDVEFLDAYARKHGLQGRSRALQAALELLRPSDAPEASPNRERPETRPRG